MSTIDMATKGYYTLKVYLLMYLSVIVFDVFFTHIVNAEVLSLVYLGPFISSIVVLEAIERKYKLPAKISCKSPTFILSTILFHTIYLSFVVITKDMSINGVGFVMIKQTLFAVGGVITAFAFQRVRNTKKP